MKKETKKETETENCSETSRWHHPWTSPSPSGPLGCLERGVALSASSVTHVLASQHSAEKSNNPTDSSHPAQTTTLRRGAA